MTRAEAERLAHQENVLMSLGFTQDEAESLRRISMTLRRWHERECGTDSGCIERGRRERNPETGKREFVNDETDAPYWCSAFSDALYRIPDRERGAQKRLLAIINAEAKRHGECRYSAYIQSDPRGAALYIIRPGDVPEGGDVSAYYSRGICVY